MLMAEEFRDKVMRRGKELTVLSVTAFGAANGTRELIPAPGPGLRLVILAMNTVNTTANSVIYRTSGVQLASVSQGNLQYVKRSNRYGLGQAFACNENANFEVVLDASTIHYGIIAYCVESV